MDIRALKRDPGAVQASLRYTSDDKLVTKTGCKILLPGRYVECGFTEIGEAIRTMAFFPFILDDAVYAVSAAIAEMWLTPSSYRIVKIDDEEHYELTFDKGAVVCPNVNLVKDDINVYRVIDEFYFKGNVPWFMGLKDVAKAFTSAMYHAGMYLAPTNMPPELLVAFMARNRHDRVQFHRHTKDPAGKGDNSDDIEWIGLRNVILGAQGTIAKITGSYIDQGITSALVNPSQKAETIEQLLRS